MSECARRNCDRDVSASKNNPRKLCGACLRAERYAERRDAIGQEKLKAWRAGVEGWA